MTYAVRTRGGDASYLHYMLLVEYNRVYHIHYLNIFSPFKNGQVIHHLTQSVFLKLDACPQLLILRITVESFVKYKLNVVFGLLTLRKFHSLAWKCDDNVQLFLPYLNLDSTNEYVSKLSCTD